MQQGNIQAVYTNELKIWFLSTSASQQIFDLHSRLAYQQWSLAPDAKICAASLSNSKILNSFVYIQYLQSILRKRIETTFSQLTNMFPRKIHAVTKDRFFA